MPDYRDPHGNLHFIESIQFENLLPPGCVQISADDAEAIRAASKANRQAVPSIVTMRQARIALLHADMLAQVNAAVAALPGVEGDEARIEWEFSSTVERDRPLVQALSGVLGLSEQQLDDLFIAADAL